MAIYRLILIDSKTGQPSAVKEINKALDLTDPIQRQLYLDTLNSLSVNETFTFNTKKSTADEVVLTRKARTTPPGDLDVYNPDKEATPKKDATPLVVDDVVQSQETAEESSN